MTSSFKQLFLMSLRLLYRNTTGIFFTLVMPLIIYVALSLLPIGATFGTGVNYSQYVLPGILAMTIMQGGIYGLAYWMIDMRSKGVIKRFLVTPISQTELIVSMLSSRVIIAVLQAVVLTLVGVIFFGAQVSWSMWPALLFVIIGSAVFLLVGLFISMLADSYEAAAPITSAIGLPLTFLGNIFFPVDGLPKVLRFVGEILPVTYMSDGIRSLFLGKTSWSVIGWDLAILTLWLIGLLLLAIWRFRLKD